MKEKDILIWGQYKIGKLISETGTYKKYEGNNFHYIKMQRDL